MANTKIDEKAVKKIVAERAKDFGDRISSREVTLDFMEGEPAPGCRLFHARWGGGRREQGLSGLIRDDEPADTYPAQALGKIFQRWLETAGELPDAKTAARVSAFMFDPLKGNEVILSEADKAAFIHRDEWLPHIQLPEKIEVSGQPGVQFWWTGRDSPSRLSMYLTPKGRIRTKEIAIQDFVNEAGMNS